MMQTEEPGPCPWCRSHPWLVFGLLAVAYLLLTQLGFLLASMHQNLAAIWPASGLAIGVLARAGLRHWPAVFLGCLGSHLFIGSPVGMSALLSGNNALEALLGAWLLRRVYQGLSHAPSIRLFFCCLLSAGVSATLSAGVGTAVLHHLGGLPNSLLGEAFRAWLAANAVGILFLTPLFFTAGLTEAPEPRQRSWARTLALALALVSGCSIVFCTQHGYYTIFAVFPLLMLAQIWFGALGLRFMALGFAAVALGATFAGLGPFSLGLLQRDLMQMQLFLAAVACCSLLLPYIRALSTISLPTGILLVGWSFGAWLFHSLQTERDTARALATLGSHPQLDLLNTSGSNLPLWIGAASVLLTLLLACLVQSLQNTENQARSLAVERTAELNQARDQLALANRLQRAVLDGTIYGVIAMDTSGLISEFNAGAERLLGYSREEVVGKRCSFDFHLRTELETRAAELSRALGRATPVSFAVPFALTLSGEVEEREWTFVRKDQRRIAILLSASALRDPNGRVTGFLGIFHDISHQKHAEAELRQRTVELALQKFALDQHAIVAVTDAAGRITYANDRFCRISKYEREELLGKSHRLLKSGHHPPSFYEELWATIRSGKVWHGELCNKAKDGTLYWVEATIVPFLREDGRPAQYIAIRTDITERKQLEKNLSLARDQALDASRLKSEFLATMSHEIRTPMNGIIGMASLLMQTQLDADQRKMGNTIQTCADNLLGIINDILDFSKIEAGKMRLEPVDFDLTRLLGETLDLLRPAARAKGIALLDTLPCELQRPLRGDAARIRQVFTNLLGNAIKFTEKGEVRAEALLLSEEGGQVEVRIRVNDTGIGISEAARQRLFEPFTQADISATRRHGGTGLGLAISRMLVELMGGTIRYQSELGKGSSFWFDLKLPMGESKMPAQAENNPEPLLAPLVLTPQTEASFQPIATPLPKKVLHVLVAEDHEPNQLVIRLFLTKAGHVCTLVENGKLAVEKVQEETFDVIVMDCQMPEMDGYAATQAIRALPAPLNQIPIIALTAYAMASDRQKCLEAGMNDYVPKPLRREALDAAFIRCGLLDNYSQGFQEPAPPSPLRDLQEISHVEGLPPELDASLIRGLRSMDGPNGVSLFVELAQRYLNNEPERLQELRDLMDQKDVAKAARCAHTMAGSAGNLGALEHRKRLLQLEETLRREAWLEAEEKYLKIEQAWQGLRSSIQSLLP